MIANWGWALCACLAFAASVPRAGEIAGASGSKKSSGPAKGAPDAGQGNLRLRGQLVQGGVECQRFRTEDGKFYTLVGDLKGFHVGDNIEIEGTAAEVSSCMQDTTVQVQKIARVK